MARRAAAEAPHALLGDVLVLNGRPEDALRAYRRAAALGSKTARERLAAFDS